MSAPQVDKRVVAPDEYPVEPAGSNEALKPCPFCGKQPERISIGTLSCNGMVDGREVHNTISMHPRYWNTRSTDTPVCASTEEVERAARRIQLWWITQKHEPMDQGVAADLARAALEASQAPETIERLRDALEQIERKAMAEAGRRHSDLWCTAIASMARSALSSIPGPSHEQ